LGGTCNSKRPPTAWAVLQGLHFHCRVSDTTLGSTRRDWLDESAACLLVQPNLTRLVATGCERHFIRSLLRRIPLFRYAEHRWSLPVGKMNYPRRCHHCAPFCIHMFIYSLETTYKTRSLDANAKLPITEHVCVEVNNNWPWFRLCLLA
jgi:hypothetical protein